MPWISDTGDTLGVPDGHNVNRTEPYIVLFLPPTFRRGDYLFSAVVETTQSPALGDKLCHLTLYLRNELHTVGRTPVACVGACFGEKRAQLRSHAPPGRNHARQLFAQAGGPLTTSESDTGCSNQIPSLAGNRSPTTPNLQYLCPLHNSRFTQSRISLFLNGKRT